MIRLVRLAVSFCLLLPLASSPASAQAPIPAAPSPAFDANTAFAVGASEWRTTVGSAWGVVVFHSAGGHRYIQQTISWGRILSGPKLSGALRGRFEWAIEVTPVYGQYLPDHIYGVGVSPLDWRWNFEPRGRYAPFAELAGGLMKSSGPVPPGTTSANFTAHAGGGVRILVANRQALVLAYRFDHISNGNRLDRNPGVNAHAVHVGWSWLQPRH